MRCRSRRDPRVDSVPPSVGRQYGGFDTFRRLAALIGWNRGLSCVCFVLYLSLPSGRVALGSARVLLLLGGPFSRCSTK